MELGGRLSSISPGLGGHDVCRLEVESSGRPVYVTSGKNADLYVRLKNSTRLLNTAEAVEYIGAHWRSG